MYFFRNAFTIVIAIILLVACASDADQEPQVQEQDEATEEEVQEEVTIQLAHESPTSMRRAFGRTTLKTLPKK